MTEPLLVQMTDTIVRWMNRHEACSKLLFKLEHSQIATADTVSLRRHICFIETRQAQLIRRRAFMAKLIEQTNAQEVAEHGV